MSDSDKSPCENGPLPPPDKDELSQLYTSLATLQTQLQNNPQDSTLQAQLSALTETKNNLLLSLVQSALQQSDHPEAERLLQADPSPPIRRLLYGYHLRRRQYTAARQLLDQLPTTSTDDQLFRDIQYINLRQLENVQAFTLTEAERDFLHDIAYHSLHGARSYARALLVRLEDAYFDYFTPAPASSRQSLATSNTPSVLLLRPNPAKDRLWIQLPAGLIRQGSIRLYNFRGQLHYEQPVRTHQREWQRSIDLSAWAPGIYLLYLEEQGRLLEARKIEIVR